MSLPDDIINYLLNFCEADTLLNISLTCLSLYERTLDIDIWSNLVKNIVKPEIYKIIWQVIRETKTIYGNVYSSEFMKNIIYRIGTNYSIEPVLFLDKICCSFMYTDKDNFTKYMNKFHISSMHFYYFIHKWYNWRNQCLTCNKQSQILTKYCRTCSGLWMYNYNIDHILAGLNCREVRVILLRDAQYRDIETNYLLRVNDLLSYKITGKINPNNQITNLSIEELIEAKSYYAKYGITISS